MRQVSGFYWLGNLLVFMFLSSVAFAQGDGSLKGVLKDKKNGEPLPFVNIVIESEGVQKAGGTSDFDGNYIIKPLSPGKYDVKVTFVGYKPQRVKDVIVKGGKITFLDIGLESTVEVLEEFTVVEYTVPLIDKDGGATGGTVTREDISKMPARTATAVASSVGGVYSTGTSESGEQQVSIRGARSSSTYFYIDGIKVRGSTNLPKSSIEEVTVITGGQPANYGDATGGVISITTRGPSSKFYGGVEAISSGMLINDEVKGLDKFGYNVLEGTLSGPILMKKDSTGKKIRPLAGFFFAANVTSEVDPRPSALGWWKVKDNVKQDLINNPIRPSGQAGGTFLNGDFLKSSDLENTPTRLNVNRNVYSGSFKVDVSTIPSVNLTFGGSLSYRTQKDWVRRSYGYNHSLLNWDNYGIRNQLDGRVFGKFTQRFVANNQESSEEGKRGGIKNAYYSLMVDYSKNFENWESARHGDNIFAYGHVGKFAVDRSKSYVYVEDVNGNLMKIHDGWKDELVRFNKSESNFELASITDAYFSLNENPIGNYENYDQIQQGGGLLNGDEARTLYNTWYNYGNNYNAFGNKEQTQFRISGTGAADIKNHEVSVGFEYEQRSDRGFQSGGRSVNKGPIQIWQQMNLMTNSHIKQLDTNNVTISQEGTILVKEFERLVGKDQYYFDYRLREKLGLDPRGTDFIDVDALDPSFFSLDMFSADELLQNGYGSSFVTYYGFDHTGKRISRKPSLEDFFNKTDQFGNLTKPVGAFEPVYASAYVMDKFSFKDIIFNVGVRIDRFDANQKVLKDPYLFREAKTVKEVGNLGPHPRNIGQDFVVYVNDLKNPSKITGYRDGNRWYNNAGIEINDASTLEQSGGSIAPYLVDPSSNGLTPGAFKDYEPQIIPMPRIAFSFPISDEALFFAHYDVLSQRPTATYGRLDPMEYFFISSIGSNNVLNNPNLKPERTTDYELGFQQVLSRSSSLKISAFYRDIKDMVQITPINQAFPKSYMTFGNVDFGTVKGLTVAYDLRKTGNVWLKTSYTLQFAEGTGSSSTSAFSLISSGQQNLRVITPFTYDRRHQINILLDYRYGAKSAYNGPVWFGKQVFANTGVNFQSNLGSGTPYTARNRPVASGGIIGQGSNSIEGSLLGSRLPWIFNVDAQLDRDITINFGKKDGEKQKTTNLNVFLLVNNLFNTLNISSIYGATGNADDDGYLTAPEYQSDIEVKNDEESFRMLYGLKVNNPYNYSIPRTIRLGVRFDF